MEASWALLDLASALDETSSGQAAQRRSVGSIEVASVSSHQQQRPPYSKPTRSFTATRRRTKSTGNLTGNLGESTGSSFGEMEDQDQHSSHDCYSLRHMHHQIETDDGSGRGRPSQAQQPPGWFAVPPRPAAIANPPAATALPGPSSSSLAPSAPLVRLAVSQAPLSVAESDSLNETVSPLRPHTRRKRRFKRMAVDPVEPPVMMAMDDHSPFSSIFAKPVRQNHQSRKVGCGGQQKKKPISSLQKVPSSDVTIGKRKRSVREPSIECELEKINLNSSPDDEDDDEDYGGGVRSMNLATSSRSAGRASMHRHHRHHLADSMDLDGVGAKLGAQHQHHLLDQASSSSVSGSESDPGGFYTCGNDDGREADDEQSDWYQEAGPAWGPPPIPIPSCKPPLWWVDAEDPAGISSADEDRQGSSSWQQLSDDSKDAYRLRMQKLRDRIPGREIRAGRRHLGAQRGPAFSILTSANEKLSRFLQDPAQSELRLHPMQKSERDQLSHLAQLYSLQMLSEGARGLKCPVLKKTSNTMQAVRIDMDRSPSLWTTADFKRQRKTPPASVAGAEEAPPCFIDESSGSSGSRSATAPTTSSGTTSSSLSRSKSRSKYLMAVASKAAVLSKAAAVSKDE